MPPSPHSSASPLRLVLTSIKGEMMETIFMGMISIKYQLNWGPQPGVQCVKGKRTSHFHKACSSGKEGLRFALIIPGFGVTLVAFHQAAWIGPNPQSTARSVYRACPCSLGCAHVSKGANAAANFCGVAPGGPGERVLGSAASGEWPPDVPLSVRFCCAPAPLAAVHMPSAPRGTASPWQRGVLGPL